MRISALIVTIFWAFLFGLVIGYIGFELLGEPINYYTMGLVSVIVSLLAIGGIKTLGKD